jgi:nucleoid-associated protein YgaU
MVVTVLDQPTLNVPLPQPRPPGPTPQQPPAPSATKPQELAVLTVNGVKFDDWESVTVQKRYGDPFTWFRFTAAERDPEVARKNEFPLWQRLQFKPGDACTVELAGIEAVHGWIEVRQVA